MPEQIQTARLVLRPFTVDDGDAVVAVLSKFEVSKWLARIPHPFTHADLRLTTEDGGDRWPALIALTLGGRVVGGMSGTAAHFGYWVDPAFHGRGIATEAGRAVLDQIFRRTEAASVDSGYFEGNPASRRVLEKLGFAEVDRYPFFCMARNHDMPNVDMRLTRERWMASINQKKAGEAGPDEGQAGREAATFAAGASRSDATAPPERAMGASTHPTRSAPPVELRPSEAIGHAPPARSEAVGHAPPSSSEAVGHQS